MILFIYLCNYREANMTIRTKNISANSHWINDNRSCPSCNKKTIRATISKQNVVNPIFRQTRDPKYPKFIPEEFVYVECTNEKCALFHVTLEENKFFSLSNSEINDYGRSNQNINNHDQFHGNIYRGSGYEGDYKSTVKNNGAPPIFKLDFPQVISKNKCPSCGSTLYKFDDKSLKQESENSFRECKNKSCRLYKVILPLGRMSDISDLEIHNFRNRQDRQDELAKGKSPFEAYDATSDKSIPDGDKLDKLRDYRYSKVKTVVKRRFVKAGHFKGG